MTYSFKIPEPDPELAASMARINMMARRAIRARLRRREIALAVVYHAAIGTIPRNQG